MNLEVKHHSTSTTPIIVPKHGVVALSGFGITARLDRGHLFLEDGIGHDRRRVRLARVGHGLKRLVVIGSDGMISLAALRWLADQDVSFAMLERNGKVLAVTGPVRPSDAKLRRVQALAFGSELGLKIARHLIEQKLSGQERVIRDILRDMNAADEIARFRTALSDAQNLATVRNIESQAAASYWAAFREVPVMFPTKDLPRVPEHWRTFGTRKSLLTGSPRLAVNPPNAILNYLYAILESESRLAAAALGLDPGLGVLHTDTTARDSLGCDIMEAIRPQIDRYVLSWILSQPLRREWFFEERNGNCRLMASLTARLSETAPTWARAVAPVAEWVAQELWTSTRKRSANSDFLPTRLTHRRKAEGRGREFVLSVAAAPKPERICRSCSVPAPHGQLCAKCGQDLSRNNMVQFAKIGRIAAQRVDAKRKRSETQLRHKAAHGTGVRWTTRSLKKFIGRTFNPSWLQSRSPQ